MDPTLRTTLRLAWRYGFAVVSIALATWLTRGLRAYLGGDISLLFFPAVVLTTWLCGLGPGLVATAIAGWASAYFFPNNPPGAPWFAYDDAVRLIVFIMFTLLVSSLIGFRKRAEAALRRSHDSLEQRVQERTAELRTFNDRLRESEEKFRLLVEGVGDYAIIMLDAAGAIASWNAGAQRLYGYTQEEMIGRPIGSLFPPGIDPASAARGLHEATQGRHDEEGWRARKDGTWFWANVNTTALHNDQGTPAGFAQITRDVTELRSLERQVLEISEQERRRMGHDLHDGLGQELTGLAFLGQNLTRKLAARSLPEAADAARIESHANRMIDQTRELARGVTPVEIGPDGLEAALRLLAGRIENLYQVRCRVEVGAGVDIRDDTAALHLYRIAQEAVNNALRHSHAGALVISLQFAGHNTVLTVSDDGVGLPPPDQRRHGMGMSLMLYRARMIGAVLEVHSPAEDKRLDSPDAPELADSSKSKIENRKSKIASVRTSGGTVVTCNYPNPDRFTVARMDSPHDHRLHEQVQGPDRGRSPDRP